MKKLVNYAIEKQIAQMFFNYLSTEPARVVGFLEGLVAAHYMDETRKNEIVEKNHELCEYLYGNSQ